MENIDPTKIYRCSSCNVLNNKLNTIWIEATLKNGTKGKKPMCVACKVMGKPKQGQELNETYFNDKGTWK